MKKWSAERIRSIFFSFVLLTLLHSDCYSNEQVLADLVAPSKIADWNGAEAWISFSGINGLVVDGTGRVGGQGSVWWPCKQNPSVRNQTLYVSLHRICFCNTFRHHLKKLYTKTRSACIYVHHYENKLEIRKGMEFRNPSNLLDYHH